MEKIKILALIDSDSKINAINPTYAAKLSLQVQKTNVGSQKIDVFYLETYIIIIAVFQVFDKFDYL